MNQPSRIKWLNLCEVVVAVSFAAIVVLWAASSISHRLDDPEPPTWKQEPVPLVESPENPDLAEVIAHAIRMENDIADLQSRLDKAEAKNEENYGLIVLNKHMIDQLRFDSQPGEAQNDPK